MAHGVGVLINETPTLHDQRTACGDAQAHLPGVTPGAGGTASYTSMHWLSGDGREARTPRDADCARQRPYRHRRLASPRTQEGWP